MKVLREWFRECFLLDLLSLAAVAISYLVFIGLVAFCLSATTKVWLFAWSICK